MSRTSAEYKRYWCAKNRERVREYKRRSYAKHVEQRRLAAAEYRRKHPEKFKLYRRKYKETHRAIVRLGKARCRKRYELRYPEKIKASKKRYSVKHPDRVVASSIKWAKKHPAKHRQYMKTWRARNRLVMNNSNLRYRARKLQNGTEKFSLNEILERDGYRCHICGKQISKNEVSFDHLIPLSKGGSHTKRNIAVAHLTCNVRRGAGRLPAQLRLY